MAKKKIIDWQPVYSTGRLASMHGNKTGFAVGNILTGVSGAVLSLIVILGLIDIVGFLIDPSEHAIGQGVNVALEGWQLSYVIKGILIIVAASSILGLMIYCTKNPQKRWAFPVIRITSVAVLLLVALGYISWASTGFDH